MRVVSIVLLVVLGTTSVAAQQDDEKWVYRNQHKDRLRLVPAGARTEVEVVDDSYKSVTFMLKRGSKRFTIPALKVAEVVYHDVPETFKAGREALAGRDYDVAVERFLGALYEKLKVRKFWVQPYALFQVAECYRVRARLEAQHLRKAIENYKKLLVEHPNTRFYLQARLHLADCQEQLGEYKEAAAMFEALKKDPKVAEMYQEAKLPRAFEELKLRLRFGASRMQERLGEVETAHSEYSQLASDARTLAPELGLEALIKSGECKVKLKRYKEARRFFTGELATLEGKPRRSAAEDRLLAACYNGMGRVLLAAGKPYGAARDYLVKIPIFFYKHQTELGKALHLLGKCYEALARRADQEIARLQKSGARASRIERVQKKTRYFRDLARDYERQVMREFPGKVFD